MDPREGRSPDVRGSEPRPARSSSTTWIVVLAVLGGAMMLVIPCLIALLLPAVQSAREAARRTQCRNNLKQIALALHNYESTYGSFPPAYVADADGKPMHSWRVLILPYLGEQPLYNMYDFSQPWDSPANQAVLGMMPQVYACPSHPSGPMSNTHYAGVFGPNCVFQGATPVKFRQITDGMSNTLMVGEVRTPIPWTSPQDVDITLNPGINGTGFGSHHVGGMHFVLGDGSVRYISESIAPATLRNLFTIDDGNVVYDF